MKKFYKNNDLSIVLFLLFLSALAAQAITGFKVCNEHITAQHGRAFTFGEYITSGHFVEATFENWESEFLRMGLFVLLTVFLFQKDSPQSKNPDKKDEAHFAKKDAQSLVKKGGLIFTLYKNYLSIAFFILFILSFILHFYGSLQNYNDDQILKGLPISTAGNYIGNSRFWFESFENWQSEFLSLFCIVVFIIFLRQKISPQSKSLPATDNQTGT